MGATFSLSERSIEASSAAMGGVSNSSIARRSGVSGRMVNGDGVVNSEPGVGLLMLRSNGVAGVRVTKSSWGGSGGRIVCGVR